MEERVLIFVYGTLMRGQSRAAALGEQRFVSEAQTQAGYRLFDCGSYPGLVQDEDGRSIYGEFWSVDADCLERLDRIEAVDEGLYERRSVRLLSPHDQSNVQTYLYAQPTNGLRDCGDRWITPV